MLKKTDLKVWLLIVLATAIFVAMVVKVFPEKGSSYKISPEDTKYVLETMGKCYRDGSSACYREAGKNLFEQFNVASVLDIFEQNEQRSEVFSRCHEVTHYLGRFEFQRVKSISEAFQNVSEVCHGGGYHGVMEGYFEYLNIPLDDIPTLSIKVAEACGKPSDYDRTTVYSECVHGIGHAMMFISEGGLVQSLALCDALPLPQNQAACYGGVFMENSSSSTNFDHPSKYLKEEDPLYPCDILGERYLSSCYSYQSSHFARLSDLDWEKVAELCRLVPEKYRLGCFRIIGSNQVGSTQDMGKRKSNCDLIVEERYRQECFRGVIGSLVGRYHRDFLSIAAFCELLATENKEDCYGYLGSSMLGWLPQGEGLLELCQSIKEEEYVAICSRAAI